MSILADTVRDLKFRQQLCPVEIVDDQVRPLSLIEMRDSEYMLPVSDGMRLGLNIYNGYRLPMAYPIFMVGARDNKRNLYWRCEETDPSLCLPDVGMREIEAKGLPTVGGVYLSDHQLVPLVVNHMSLIAEGIDNGDFAATALEIYFRTAVARENAAVSADHASVTGLPDYNRDARLLAKIHLIDRSSLLAQAAFDTPLLGGSWYMKP